VRVTVRLFAMLRERAGSDSIEIELDESATVADAIAALGRDPQVGDLASRLPLRLAVNHEYAPADATIAPGDELAAIPPVSGGAGRVRLAKVMPEPLDQAAITALVGDPGAGAVVTFQGTTRDVDKLTYEVYEEMAEPRIAEILDECAAAHDLMGIAAAHRIGDVPLGQPSVVVAASAAHRAEAFAGARDAIDRIKAEAPIWKQEVSFQGEGDQESWVEGTVP
jgi:MoaE-MoaD fusion protein